MMSIAIYIEGGGDTAQTLAPFRRGMSDFLKPVVDEARKRRIHWRVIPCGGRKAAFDAFLDAVKNKPDVHNVLLVDSEDPVAITTSPWTHLHNRQGDGWKKPSDMDDSRCQLMVACMEAWFLADRNGLKKHFGGNFDEEKLPPENLAESRTKDAIEAALRQATRNTPAAEYRKIRDGAKLLSRVNPAVVRKHCQWCDRLFTALEKVIK
jgi:hypothetical protein